MRVAMCHGLPDHPVAAGSSGHGTVGAAVGGAAGGAAGYNAGKGQEVDLPRGTKLERTDDTT